MRPLTLHSRAIKTAKGILKQDSNSLLLWDAYARIELSTGNKKMTRTVYANALALAQSFDDEKSKMDMPLLWRAWVELEWEDGRLDATLAVLTASSKPQVGKSALGKLTCARLTAPADYPRRRYSRLSHWQAWSGRSADCKVSLSATIG